MEQFTVTRRKRAYMGEWLGSCCRGGGGGAGGRMSGLWTGYGLSCIYTAASELTCWNVSTYRAWNVSQAAAVSTSEMTKNKKIHVSCRAPLLIFIKIERCYCGGCIVMFLCDPSLSLLVKFVETLTGLGVCCFCCKCNRLTWILNQTGLRPGPQNILEVLIPACLAHDPALSLVQC